MGELKRGTNDAPHNTRRPKHLGAWTNKAIFLMLRTHILHIRKHPRLHAQLDRPRNNGRNDLAPKYRTRWDLHIMSQLEIRREGQGLRRGDVAPRFEHHHGDGTT